MFLDTAIGYPGGMHDARVLQNSELYRKVVNENILWEPLVNINGNNTWPLLPAFYTIFVKKQEKNSMTLREIFFEILRRGIAIEREYLQSRQLHHAVRNLAAQTVNQATENNF